jgi:hypothetical protein
MPNLPIHLQPGSYLAKNEPYTLRHPWQDDCMVAWGRQSIENGQLKLDRETARIGSESCTAFRSMRRGRGSLAEPHFVCL